MNQEHLFNTVGYYFWLIPSILSCFFSSLILLRNIFSKLTIISFSEVLFVIGDLLQCSAWFFGSIYTLSNNRNNQLCHQQEIIFEFGLLMKGCILLIACGIFAKYTLTRKRFSIFFPSLLIICFTVLMIVCGYVFKSRVAACQSLLNHSIQTSTTAELSYIFFFVFPLTVYAYLILILSLLGLSSRHQDSFVSTLLSTIYDRLILFFVVVLVVMIPFHCFYILASIGRMNIVVYCLTGLIVSSTGALFSLYLLVSPLHEKWKKFNVFFFIEIMVSNERDDSENEEVNSSQKKHSSRDDSSLDQRLWVNFKFSETSASVERQSESEMISRC